MKGPGARVTDAREPVVSARARGAGKRLPRAGEWVNDARRPVASLGDVVRCVVYEETRNLPLLAAGEAEVRPVSL